MHDPAHANPDRIVSDVHSWLADLGSDLLRGESFSLEELGLECPYESAEIRDVIDIHAVTLLSEPDDIAPGSTRAHFSADVQFTYTIPEAPRDRRDAETRANIDFELDLLDGEIPPDPSFQITSIAPPEDEPAELLTEEETEA